MAPSVLVYGAGVIGSVYAVRLARAGSAVNGKRSDLRGRPEG